MPSERQALVIGIAISILLTVVILVLSFQLYLAY